MKLASMFAAAAAMTLAAAPAVAAPNAASALSVSKSVRAGTTSKGKSELAAPGAIVGLVLAAAVVAAGVFIAVDDNSDSN